MKSVSEVSKLSGISRRTLQYYDEIGLLLPSMVKESGYRQYDDESLRRLWSILFYRELGMSLNNIRSLLDNPKNDEKELIQQHKQILLRKQEQLKKMMLSVDRILNDEFEISILRDFDKNRIELAKKTYAKELQALTQSGIFIPLVKNGIIINKLSVIKNASRIMSVDLGGIISFGYEVIEKFNKAMKDGSDSFAAKNAVAAFSNFVNILLPCDDEAFCNIAQVYLKEKEEMDKKVPGLAEFVSAAILNVYQKPNKSIP